MSSGSSTSPSTVAPPPTSRRSRPRARTGSTRGTLAVATDNLVTGSTDYEGQVWPWSYTSRLVACALFMLFLLGLYVTRRPRSSRR